MLKVLSAREILSIQMHPNKKQAQELHNQDPKNYPDTNHKPEIAIALDSLTALVGLIDDQELRTVMKLYPELRTVTAYDQNPGQTAEASFKILLQTAEQNQPVIAAVDREHTPATAAQVSVLPLAQRKTLFGIRGAVSGRCRAAHDLSAKALYVCQEPGCVHSSRYSACLREREYYRMHGFLRQRRQGWINEQV